MATLEQHAANRQREPITFKPEVVDEQVAEEGLDVVLRRLRMIETYLAAQIESGKLDPLEKLETTDVPRQVKAKLAALTQLAALLEKPVNPTYE